jgi:hypothetical protein
MNDRVTATCIVNDLGARQFEVIVSGALAWVDHTRTYVVKARSEDDAAQQGLRAFETEMGNTRYVGPMLRLN